MSKLINTIKHKTPFFHAFGLVFLPSSVVSLGLYYGINALGGHPFSCGYFFRCWAYWEIYPIPYLLALALTYAGVCGIWFSTYGRRIKRFPKLQLAALPIVSLFPAGFLGGMLWAYHDMAAGFFPEFPRMIGYIWDFAWTGFLAAPFIALTSFPLNIFGLIGAYLIAAFAANWLGLAHYRIIFFPIVKQKE